MGRLDAHMTMDVCRARLVRGMAIWLTVMAGSTLSLARQAPSGSPLAGILAALALLLAALILLLVLIVHEKPFSKYGCTYPYIWGPGSHC